MMKNGENFFGRREVRVVFPEILYHLSDISLNEMCEKNLNLHQFNEKINRTLLGTNSATRQEKRIL